ncbi:hypothetical protein [Demequina salsinemoris]|uniref:hypothetical protein n=1 Tax=Demequina salsinemoris TaxID=577470 RepID=UPI00078370A0|nr:hypothetical protein [Demequina salsinemoris]
MGKWVWRLLLVAIVAAAIYYVPKMNALAPVPITTVSGYDYEQELTVRFDDCTRDHDVVVEETDTTVTLTARAEWMGLISCTSRDATETVTLSEPLRDRELIDGKTGESLELQAP